MIIRTQEKYKTDASAVVWLAIDLLIFVLTLLNTGGRDLPAPRADALNIGQSVFGVAHPTNSKEICFLS